MFDILNPTQAPEMATAARAKKIPSKAEVRFEILLTPELDKAVRDYSKRTGRKRTEICREAIAATIKRPDLGRIRTQGMSDRN